MDAITYVVSCLSCLIVGLLVRSYFNLARSFFKEEPSSHRLPQTKLLNLREKEELERRVGVLSHTQILPAVPLHESEDEPENSEQQYQSKLQSLRERVVLNHFQAMDCIRGLTILPDEHTSGGDTK